MEPYEKIYVSKDFLDSDHGQIGCPECHGGDPDSFDWQTAHAGLTKDPTYPEPQKTCGECHPEIATSAPGSLHYTLAPMAQSIERRMGNVNNETRTAITKAYRNHCSQCHSSCGQCHVSRPNYVNGGFLAQHRFQKTPPMETTCASCHGGRVFAEYTGLNSKVKADIHFESADMSCQNCHDANQMHAVSETFADPFESPSRPRCEDCHPEAATGKDSDTHSDHTRTVACQVCHAQPIKHCFGCHVGTDDQGLAYYKCQKTLQDFKIGLNPQPSALKPQTYVVLRHVPVEPDTFDHYVSDDPKAFASAPTWKLCNPHTIQRRTPQNETCNNCHGQHDLFLSPADIATWEVGANIEVIVPTEMLPARIKEAGTTPN